MNKITPVSCYIISLSDIIKANPDIFHRPEIRNIDEMINEGVEKAKQNNYIQKDDIIVIAGGASILSCHDGATTNRTIGGVLKI